METYLGNKGLDRSWQSFFKETVKCHKCGGKARIMFVGIEEPEVKKDSPVEAGEFVWKIRKNGGKGDYWVHDYIAVAVYLCKDCFEAVAVLNQA